MRQRDVPRDAKKVQDPAPLVTKHLNAIRRTTEYKLFLQAAARACNARGSRPEDNLGRVADAVLRPIARDLSACCPGNKVIIFHMMAMNEKDA